MNNSGQGASGEKRSILQLAVPRLDDLPDDVLTDIFSKVSLPKHITLRGMCRRFLELDDKYTLNEFKKAVREATRSPVTAEHHALMVVNWATEAYLHLGMGSKFCDSFMAVLNHNDYKNQQPFSFDRMKMLDFLLHFFDSVHRGWDCSHQSEYSLLDATIFRLLGKFENRDVRWIISQPFFTRFEVELTGVWLGWVPAQPIPPELPETPYSLIAILATLLLGQKTRTPLNELRDGRSFEMFIYGYRAEPTRRARPTTTFAVSVFGAQEVRMFLKDCLEKPDSEFSWSAEIPVNKFTLTYSITSRKAASKGCARVLQLISDPANVLEADNEIED